MISLINTYITTPPLFTDEGAGVPNRAKSVYNALVWTVFSMVLLLSLLMSYILLLASRANYPGGQALHALIHTHIGRGLGHSLTGNGKDSQMRMNCGSVPHPSSVKVKVHIDVAAAMTGVTRFGQEQGPSFKRGTYS